MMKARSNNRAANRGYRLARAALMCCPGSKICPPDRATELLEAIIEPGDRVVIEGDNQKQADFLAAALAKADPARLHDLHMVQSVLALPDHLAVFERGIANRLDFAFAGPQSRRLAELVASGSLKIGAILTYLELYARMLVDLRPRVALVVADEADRHGNLYTGPNTEDTPMIVEAAAFSGGVVVAQVNEIVEHLPRVDIPGDWVDVVVQSPAHYAIEPLFTRDPAKIREDKILMAMMAIAAVYQPYEIRRLNHGIGYATAAIELILPTFGAARGLKGKVATHFVLNPHPTLIPAIEAGFVESVYCFGSELGMERYVSERADVFPVGADGRPICLRPLRRRDPSDRCAGQQFDGNQGKDRRFRRRTQHGRRCARAPAYQSSLVARGPAGRRQHQGPQACPADGRDPPARWDAELRGAARRGRSRNGSRIRIAAGDDLRRRRHPRHHRAGCRKSPAVPVSQGTRRRAARHRRRHGLWTRSSSRHERQSARTPDRDAAIRPWDRCKGCDARPALRADNC